jgi:hypothetical protein
MTQKYIQIIKGQEQDIPGKLQGVVLSRITLLAHRQKQYREAGGFAASIVSLFALVSLAWYAFVQFQQSGFATYFSLIFTDSRVVWGSFSDFALSLVEATPFFAMTGFLIACIIFLISMRYVVGQLSKASYSVAV